MNDSITNLGLSCLDGATFYTCQDSPIAFLGCCKIDPCSKTNGGTCPSSALAQATFDADKYAQIPGQACVKYSTAEWYTCIAGPTFLGCCTSNPCANDGLCPNADLVGAVLSKNPKDAAPFLNSTLSSPSETSTPTPGGSNSGAVSHTGSIVGGVIGGVVGLVLLGFLVLRCCRRRRDGDGMAREEEESGGDVAGAYHDSHNGSAATRASVSSLSTVNTRRWSPMSLSSISSIMGFKRHSSGGNKNRKSQNGHEMNQNGHRMAELDALEEGGGMLRPESAQNKMVYEVPGSMPMAPEAREMPT